MANRYWVGGTASWDGTAGTKWATTSGGAGGAAIPTSADDVFFDAASGANTVTIATGNTGAKSITCTGFTGTLTGTAAITVSGNITLVAGMTYSHTGTVTINATATLITAAKSFSALTVNGSGITVTLGDALNCGTRTITITQGTFTTSASNYSVTAGIFSITGSTTRTVTLNGSTVTLSAASSISWNAATTTNLTFNANTSSIVLSGASATFSGGGLTYNNVSLTSTTSGGYSIRGANTFAQLTLTAPGTAGISTVSFDSNQTITTLVASGASAVRRLQLYSNSFGTAITLTVTTWSTISDLDFRDISMNTSRSGTRLGNLGGNTNITFTAAKTVYWNLAGTQNWSATGWATTSTGAPAVNNFPLAQDTATFTNSGSAGTVTIEAAWNIGTIDMSGRTNAMTFASTSDSSIFGNLTFGSGVTPSSSGFGFAFYGRSTTQTLTSAGKTLPYSISVSAIGGTVRLGDALTSSSSANDAITVTDGTFDTQNFNVTFTDSLTDFTIVGSNAKTLTLGSSVISIKDRWNTAGGTTNTTITANTATLRFSGTTPQFSGGGLNYNGLTVDQGGSGTLTIGGNNTLGNISNSYSATGATTITLAGNQTLSNFTATGAAGKVLTLNSSSVGVARTMTKTTAGNVSVSYLNIKDSTVTGSGSGSGVTWTAAASTDSGNNTGWTFTAAPPSTGNFLMFFM